MKSSKSRLTIVAAAILFAALSFPVMANNIGTQQNVAAAMDMPQARPPVFKIGGKLDDRVYLQSLDIQVEVTGNIASTRYTMVFKNRTSRILGGELTFPLPDGRTVTHYALDINGKMREAVPVDKAKATQVFEEIQRREVDPGILERVEGNNFRTRIYPIPRNGTRTISIGYEEELALEKELLHYRLPMAYPDSLEKFAVKATVWKSGVKPIVPETGDEIRFDKTGGNYVASFIRENYKPARALTFTLPAPADIPRVVMQSAQGSNYFLASIAPKMETRPKQWSDELAIIWDVSLSGSQRDLKREMEMLDVIFAEKKNVDVHLYFLNNKLKKMVDMNTVSGEYKVINGNWGELKKVLEAAVFDGGTDFSQINLNDIAGNEILFFSDGISTLSDADFLKNTEVNRSIINNNAPANSGRQNAAPTTSFPVDNNRSIINNNVPANSGRPMVAPTTPFSVDNNRPIHCVVSSAKADYGAMKLIAGKSKGKFININALSSEKLKYELLNEAPQFLGMEGKGIREAYPNIATPVHGNFSVAGISNVNNTELTLLFGFGGKVEKRIKVKLDAQKATRHGNIYKIWAQKKIAELDLEYEKNRAELAELGQQFGIVTRNTTLMVLELIDDYDQYEIEPPASEPELRAEYRRRLKERGEQQRKAERNMLNDAVAAAEEFKKWWNTDFTPKNDDGDTARTGMAGVGYGVGYASGFGGGSGGIGDLSGEDNDDYEYAKEDEKIAITLKPVREDSDYLKQLTGKLADDYQIYLKLRDDYANSPTFYFDMANWFYKRNDRETALRILTSIAELELENASLYRLLGYRFKEYGEYTLQKFVCKKVIQWRPMEPQSYRDYAFALADNGEAQAALDSLYSMLTRPFSEDIIRRSCGIDEVAVTEINHLITKNPNIKTSKIDKRLIINVPVDIRVVINWNMNDTDIDLHVKDPNGNVCYHGNKKTKIGGRMSADNTDGYGPEQFMLKKAVRGKYQVYVNYYGAREFTQDGPSTVMAEFFTKYAGTTEQRRIVCLQLSNAKGKDDEKVEIAEFEF